MIGTPLAFSVVIVGCLFAPEKHDVLLAWSIFGLWLSALESDNPKIRIVRGGDEK